jgi:hypothetical protein
MVDEGTQLRHRLNAARVIEKYAGRWPTSSSGPEERMGAKLAAAFLTKWSAKRSWPEGKALSNTNFMLSRKASRMDGAYPCSYIRF